METRSDKTRHSRRAAPSPTKQKITSSRIVNPDGSIPRTTDELIIRGFQKLRDEKRRRHDEHHAAAAAAAAPPRHASDGSSKSSATYVCSSPERATARERGGISSAFRHTAPSLSAIEEAGAGFRRSLEGHEAKIRAVEAQILAVKRAATLTRELRREAGREQSRVVRDMREGGGREGRGAGMMKPSGDGQALMSGGNGRGEDSVQIRPSPPTQTAKETMEGLPTPPQLLPLGPAGQESTGSQRTHRTKEKRKFCQATLCLCPKCMPVTQQVVNTLAARYAMQSREENARLHHAHHLDQGAGVSGKSRSYSHHISDHDSSVKARTHVVARQHPKSTGDLTSRSRDLGKAND